MMCSIYYVEPSHVTCVLPFTQAHLHRWVDVLINSAKQAHRSEVRTGTYIPYTPRAHSHTMSSLTHHGLTHTPWVYSHILLKCVHYYSMQTLPVNSCQSTVVCFQDRGGFTTSTCTSKALQVWYNVLFSL